MSNWNTVLKGKEMYSGPAIVFSDEFRQMVEDHLGFLREHPDTRVLQVANLSKIRYDYDLYRFIAEQYRMDYAWTVMRVNGFYSPLEFNMSMGMSSTIMLPSFNALENLKKKQEAKQLII